MATQGKKRGRTLFSFYNSSASTPAPATEVQTPSTVNIEENSSAIEIRDNPCEQPIFKSQRIEIDLNTLERDPGIRKPIWQYDVNQRDAIRRAYIKMGPYQPKLAKYPKTKYGSQAQARKFQYSWFDKYRWLEYSPEKDSVFCFPCFIFQNKSPLHPSFTTEGFSCWKRVNDGIRCPLLMHVGCPTSPHRNAVQCVAELMKVAGHIDKVITAQSLEDVQKNRLRLKATIEGVKYLSLQACPFRGHDESCQQKDSMTICQYYHFDIFNSAIDFQREELNSRFSDGAIELLALSSSLDPKDNFKAFKAEKIYKLAEKFYPADFTEQEMHYLKCQLEHYKLDVVQHESFQNMSTITELCCRLVETNKLQHYNLIDRLIRLVLTLPVSTATTERSFSAMKLVKTDLRNKMEEEFLADSMMLYIEREFVEDIDSDSIIDEFYFIKNRRLQLK